MSDARDTLCVVLVGARNPLNIGAAARAMSNFGFFHLRVVNAYAVAFREARSAVDALPLLRQAEEFATLAEAVADCTLVAGTSSMAEREARQPVYSLPQAGPRLRQHMRAGGRVALLFGSEKTGLSNRDLSHCEWLLRIPARVEHGSMNLGQAVAVCLYELIREESRSAAGEAAPELSLASAGELERITGVLMQALRASASLEADSAAAAEERVRRIVRRLRWRTEDAHAVLRLLRRVVWRMRHPDGQTRTHI